MTVPAFHELREASRHSLQAASNPKRIIFLHTGITVSVLLVLMLGNFLLEQSIANTGGLGGLATRSLLETIQAVLMLAQSILLPFWQMGYLFYTLKVAQGDDAGTSELPEGFRRFGPILRLKIMMVLIVVLVAMVSSYIANFIFMLSPWSTPMLEALEPILSGTLDPTTMDPDAIMALYASIPMSSVVPGAIIFLICLVALLVPVYYRYRMADLWLMDHPGQGALAALRNSRKMMRGNCMDVFRIDLHFWWFFALDLLISLIPSAYLALPLLGITLPFAESVVNLLLYAIYLASFLGLCCWRQNEVSVTYAHLYKALKPSEETQV